VCDVILRRLHPLDFDFIRLGADGCSCFEVSCLFLLPFLESSRQLTVFAYDLKLQTGSQDENANVEFCSIVSLLRVVPVPVLQLEVLRFELRFDGAYCASAVFF